MARLQIRLVTENDPISYFIRKETDFPYSHVEFLTDPEWGAYYTYWAQKNKSVAGQWAGFGTVGAHFSGGFEWRPIDYAKFVASELAYVECTDEQKVAVMAETFNQLGTPYDALEIAGIWFHQNWSTKGHWICSRVVGSLLQKAGGLKLFNMPDDILWDSITPRDIYLSPLLQFPTASVNAGIEKVSIAQYKLQLYSSQLNFSLGRQEDGRYISTGTFAI